MDISAYSSYSANMLKQDISLSMIRETSDMQAQAVDKIMSSVQPQAVSAPVRPGVGQNLNVYA
ncbi:putative motility protein [Brachyspira alvinipulli]|uniref:putative motility protein n=1 Tax=Brachyspira alvinipulli TaxID=84379 RepID=UPI000482B29F|nr:putative motility protein [Brachyspira alvinipulli]